MPNAGFEEGDKDLAGWEFSLGEEGQGDWAWETKRVHSGKRAIRVRKSNSVGYSMLASDYIPLEAGKEYEARAWVHVEGRSHANVYFMISQYTADSPEMRFPNAFSIPRPLYTGDGWKQLRVRFTVRPGNARVRTHVLLNRAPATVIWDDFELEPAAEEVYRPRYEKPRPEELPPLEQARERLQRRQRAVADRKVIDGRVRFFFDGRPVEPAFYVAPFHNQWNAQIADFRGAGVRVYLLPLTLGRGSIATAARGSAPARWTLPRSTSSSGGSCAWILTATSSSIWPLIPTASGARSTRPRSAPIKMARRRSSRCIPGLGTRAGSKARERYAPSLVSSVLRRDTIEAIRRLIRHVNSSLPGKAVAGYHIAGLNDGQFFQWARHDPKDLHLADYSEASRRAFRDWLRRFYRNDLAAFRRAWGRPDVTFETAEIPSGERRLASGFFLTLPRDQDIADYNRFYSEGTVETIHAYARVVKEETQGRALVSTYWEDAAAGVDSHLATGRMLQSPDIDFLAGPAAYGVRMAGEVGECHSTWGSLSLHGRIKLTEQDWRSWLSGWRDPQYDYNVGRAENAADHNAMVRRECGMMLAYGHGTWWYDMSGGWFRDDQIMRGSPGARRFLATCGFQECRAPTWPSSSTSGA